MPHFTQARPMTAKALRKPRNPVVAPALLRQAGRHQGPHARQSAQSQLRHALQDLHPPTPHD
ncbi:hypothetical protein [Inhella crocodyli]|uniref:Uncharacterized protein n=1 Tax=Inhella crocodyli TaxID=2499851 RepID=A0A437LTL4_9BURK|nr:hypothetical protein [Inhella crocodyli]RVT88684.1 hypothetical protein EOD73_06870 [Inhella crocodyli]